MGFIKSEMLEKIINIFPNIKTLDLLTANYDREIEYKLKLS